MDVMRLNPTTYLPDEIVDGYSSMVWTERKVDDGEFELKTPTVAQTRLLLPEKSLITHLETREVMIVETHSIENDDNGIPELTISGRTYSSFSENRSMVAPTHGKEWQSILQYTSSEIVSMLLWTHLANDTGQDPSRSAGTLSALIRVANLVVTDSVSLADTPKLWTLKPGELRGTISEFLSLGGLGLRTIRPGGTSGEIVTVDTTATASRGTVSRTLDSDIQELRLDVYHGTDRTANQSVNDPIKFDYEADDIETPSYLFSSKRLKNLAVVSASTGVFDVWPGETPNPEPSGFDRRALYFDGGEKDAEQTEQEFQDSLTQKARVELQKHNREVLFDGAVSPISQYKYNEDYFLGDKVTLSAEYDLESTMEVVEYVRTEDQSGDRGYPTLVLAE